MSAMRGASEVSDFYEGRSVLVTGGTGFIGKVLVEKLVRSCPGIARVYMLVRPCGSKDVAERLDDVLRGPLFQKLRAERPQDVQKIEAIKGDMTQPGLGLSPEDRRLVEESVTVVFHTAATIKLDEEMRRSVRINVLGTRRLLRICERGRVEVFVHVSTAYCNCDRRVVREEVYQTVWDPERVIQWAEQQPQEEEGAGDAKPGDCEEEDGLARTMIHNLPNTYTFTKALAENLLLKSWGDMRLVIVRPSIVVASSQEPFPGWVDNWNGPTGILAAAGKGLIRTLLCHQEKVADLVPVDMVANLMICSAWDALDPSSSEGPKVYNCCTGTQNPITWKKFIDLSFQSVQENPFGNEIWYPSTMCTTNPFVNSMCSLVMHSVPALVLDTAYWLTGRAPKMVKLHQKMEKVTKTLQHFVTREWSFPDPNVRHLNALLSDRDRQLFPFDARRIDWPSYLRVYLLGIRQYMFHEPPSSLPAARKRIVRLFWLHRTLQLLFVLLTCRVLVGYPKFIKNV